MKGLHLLFFLPLYFKADSIISEISNLVEDLENYQNDANFIAILFELQGLVTEKFRDAKHAVQNKMKEENRLKNTLDGNNVDNKLTSILGFTQELARAEERNHIQQTIDDMQ
jgi:adenylylsulfate kinase-like enzyme